MSNTALDRRRARRVATAAQVVAALLLVTGVAAAMVLPRGESVAVTPVSLDELRDRARAQVVERDAANEGSSGDTDPAFPPDFEGIAERYTFATDIVPPEPPASETDGTADEPSETAQPDAGSETPIAPAPSARVRYLGMIQVGSSRVALVAVGDKQSFIAVGRTKTISLGAAEKVTVEVVEISSDEVVLVEDGTRRTVTLTERQTSALSQTSAPVAADAPTGDEAAPTRAELRARRSGDAARERNPLDRENFRRPDGTIDYQAMQKAARENSERVLAERRRAAERNGERDGER
jgi:hypothetical protein